MASRRLYPLVAGFPPTFLCCDLQSAFATKIKRFDDAVFEANRFARIADIIEAKYVVSEQYPKGLGHTVPEIVMPTKKELLVKYEKTKFSMVPDNVEGTWAQGEQFVLFGIEAHVCVQQTVKDLLQFRPSALVFIPSNAVFSQYDSDRKEALKWMRSQDRVVVSTSESLMFDMLGDAKHPLFRQISPLFRERQPSERASEPRSPKD